MNMNTGLTISTSMNSTMNATMNASMMSDAMSEPSSPDSPSFDETDLLNASVADEVTSQLAASGTVGMAAAAAIATGKLRKRPFQFEINPSIRKRQQTRLLRKLKATVDEFTTRVGQQAVVMCCTPGKINPPSQSYKVFGSQPLEQVLRSCKGMVMQELESLLAQQAPPPQQENPALADLPPLLIDGLPTPVDKMTQAQLRTFIPLMLKYSTGRGKPGWGKMEFRPEWWPNDVPWANVRSDVRNEDQKQRAQLRAFIPEMLRYSHRRSKPGWGKPEFRPFWWPDDVPWANVRSDVRTEEQKRKVSWTHALRTIVKNCYKHHGREDLLPAFGTEEHQQTALQGVSQPQFPHQTMVQTINNPDGTVSIIQIDTGDGLNPHVVTLADGTQAQVVQTLSNTGGQQEANQAVQTLAEVAASHHQDGLGHQTNPVSVEMNHDGVAPHAAIATLNQDGQIILHGDTSGLGEVSKDMGDGGDNKMGQIIGMVTIPVSMYQTVVTNLAQVQQGQVAGAHQLQTMQVTMAPSVGGDGLEEQHDNQQLATPKEYTQNGVVPDATQAVEVMTIEPIDPANST